MRSFFSLFLALPAVAIVAACSGSDGEVTGAPPATVKDETNPSSIPGRACPDRSPLTYQSFGAPFFFNYCTGCHSSKLPAERRRGAPNGIDFDTLGGIRTHAQRIFARAADGNVAMPPAGGPSADQRKQLGDWLACGAPGDEQALSAKSLPPKESTPAECNQKPQALPAAVLPRCSAATWQCMASCYILDFGCEEKCIAADTTAPFTGFGGSFDCGSCINYQEYYCTDANGCHDVVAELECCRRDKCGTSTDPNCLVDKCKSEAYAYGYCLNAVTPTCASRSDGPARQCFPANVGASDAGKD
jgi:hypothetical protein